MIAPLLHATPMRRSPVICSALLALITSGAFLGQTGAGNNMPPLKRRSGPQAVVDEHLDALNHCDWGRLMAQYPPGVEIFLPGGQIVKGRAQVGELFRSIVKPFNQGGVCGVKFETEHAFLVGNTVNAQWRVTADFLAEPYRGADAYVTKGGLMWAQVTTFQRDQLKTK
jgi:SnoaL-like domain